MDESSQYSEQSTGWMVPELKPQAVAGHFSLLPTFRPAL